MHPDGAADHSTADHRTTDDFDDHDDSAADDHHYLDHDFDDHDNSAADDHQHVDHELDDHNDSAADDDYNDSAADDDHNDSAADNDLDDRAADAGDVHRSPRPCAGALLQRGAQHGGPGIGANRNRVRSQPGELDEQRLRRGDHSLQHADRGRHVHRHRHRSAGTAHHPRSLPAVRGRLLQRSQYWRASGTGQLTANGVSVPFSFTLPTLTRTIDLTGQNVESTTISVSISMSAGRSTNFPQVTNPPGSASISVTSAVISVESA